MRVLGLIPARGGSKRIPGKNVKLLGGKPLIAWTIESAMRSRYIDRVILSSEDQEIIEVALKLGCEVPFVRPQHLATDEAKTSDVVMHALEEIGAGYDYLVLLQPTSPFRSSEDIDGSISLCIESRAPSVVSVREIRERPDWMCLLDDAGQVRCPLAECGEYAGRMYILNGAVYVVSCQWFLENGAFIADSTRAFKMPWWRSVDVDTMEDWLLAELILDRYLYLLDG
ncbi:cytidylyltransferase domain-containing protein [Thermanaerovibrio velox]|nr:acylneuraminate cytidylyltransferase family protein [Thermanaerovibrio velox]